MNAHPTSTEMGRGRGTALFPGTPFPKTNLSRLHKTLDTPQFDFLPKALDRHYVAYFRVKLLIKQVLSV